MIYNDPPAPPEGRVAEMTETATDGITAAGRLLVDARLAEWLLCDVYADRPEEGLRIFWELSGDSLLDAIAVLHSAGRHSPKE